MRACVRAPGYPAPVGLGLCCPALGEPEQQKPLNSETGHLGKVQSVKTRSIYSWVWEEGTTLQTTFIQHSQPAWSSAWFVPRPAHLPKPQAGTGNKMYLFRHACATLDAVHYIIKSPEWPQW